MMLLLQVGCLLFAEEPIALQRLHMVGTATEVAVGENGAACSIYARGLIDCTFDNENIPFAGGYHGLAGSNGGFCAISEAGRAECFGMAASMDPFGTDVQQISMSSQFACVVSGDGAIECANLSGSDYHPEYDDAEVTSFSIGDEASCYLDMDGEAVCFDGYDKANQRITDPPEGPFTEVAVASSTACGIDEAGEVQCWGKDVNDLRSPITSDAAVSLASSATAFCALQEDSTIMCWGGGDAANDFLRDPFVDVALGDWTGCAVTPDGDVTCWGRSDTIAL